MPNESLPTSQELIKELKVKVDSLADELEDLRDCNPSLKSALVWGHLATIVQGAKAVILCANCKQYAGVAPILRSILECVVNCSILQKDKKDEDCLHDGYKENLKVGNKRTNQIRQEYTKEELAMVESIKPELKEVIDETKPPKEKQYKNIEAKFIALDWHKEYNIYYSNLSSGAHCSIDELSRRHIQPTEDDRELVWYTPTGDNAAFFLSMLLTFLEMAQPCLDQLNEDIIENMV